MGRADGLAVVLVVTLWVVTLALLTAGVVLLTLR